MTDYTPVQEVETTVHISPKELARDVYVHCSLYESPTVYYDSSSIRGNPKCTVAGLLGAPDDATIYFTVELLENLIIPDPHRGRLGTRFKIVNHSMEPDVFSNAIKYSKLIKHFIG